ncbi:hypothetical protein ACHQM5_010225 [Ranunculus cassubicifolius]
MAGKQVIMFVFAAMLMSFSTANAQDHPLPAKEVQQGLQLGNCFLGCEVKCFNCLAMCTIKGKGAFVCLMDCKGDGLKCIAKCSSSDGGGCAPPPPRHVPPPPPPPPCKGCGCPNSTCP